MKALRFLITAGPTREFLDPVRYLSNRSSGKMGYALAEAAQASGGAVVLVSGPTALAAPAGVEFVPVVSAQEMADAVLARLANCDVVIMAAAVCDFRPRQVAPQKIKKQGFHGPLELEPTVDILAELGRRKTHQMLVGFAVESENLEGYAREKLLRKGATLVVANPVAAFDADVNRALLLSRDEPTEVLPELTKRALAAEIITRVARRVGMNKVFRKLIRVRLTDEQRDAQLRRIMLVETNIMLPVKVVAIIAAWVFYDNMLRAMAATPASDIARAYVAQLDFYAAGNVILWLLLLAARLGQTWPHLLRFSAFSLAILDNLFLSGLVYFTGGLQSPLYWLFIGLMIRSAVNFPIFWQQSLLNFGVSLFYTLAVLLSEEDFDFFQGELYWLRLTLLVVLGACCWGVYMLLERERIRSRAQQEFQLREQSAAATGRLAAEMAHQLKNPLGIINNAAYLLQRQFGAKAGGAAEAVGVIREEVVRCDKILTHLMDYARLSEGRIESVDLNRTLEQALAQASPMGLPPTLRLVQDLAPDLPGLPAQRAQIEDCFLNLIQNALEAMPAGGTLTLQTRYVAGGKIELVVGDTGPGIPPEIVGKIFDAFYTTKSGGTGLGLAIVKNVVETYGGTVAVDSAPGAGTRFQIILPARAGLAR